VLESESTPERVSHAGHDYKGKSIPVPLPTATWEEKEGGSAFKSAWRKSSSEPRENIKDDRVAECIDTKGEEKFSRAKVQLEGTS